MQNKAEWINPGLKELNRRKMNKNEHKTENENISFALILNSQYINPDPYLKTLPIL